MTQEQLEEKIKNEETVWVIDKDNKPYKLKLKSNMKLINDDLLEFNRQEHPNLVFCRLIDIFETKEELRLYLDYGCVIRVEKMPFITYEEFKNGKKVRCYDKNGELLKLYYIEGEYFMFHHNNATDMIELTEENFYETYAEMKKLFLGE